MLDLGIYIFTAHMEGLGVVVEVNIYLQSWGQVKFFHIVNKIFMIKHYIAAFTVPKLTWCTDFSNI